MSNTQIGLLAGLLLALAAITGGFGGVLLAVVFGTAAAALGAHRDGSIDLGAVVRGRVNG